MCGFDGVRIGEVGKHLFGQEFADGEYVEQGAHRVRWGADLGIDQLAQTWGYDRLTGPHPHSLVFSEPPAREFLFEQVAQVEGVAAGPRPQLTAVDCGDEAAVSFSESGGLAARPGR